ncbi:MAG: ferritin family protein [Nitrospirota bacterium]
MNFYRCLICGDPYGGKEKPSHCPFCGAKSEYIVSAAEWIDENTSIATLSNISRKNLERTLQLEVNNTAFYRDAMGRTKDIELQGIFKYLSKVEGEHASVVKKILKCEAPNPEPGKEVASDNDHENLKRAQELEKFAAKFYSQAAGEAVEPRVKKVFIALSTIESEHIRIEGELLTRK